MQSADRQKIGQVSSDHAPGPVATDGEAANPGPRLRKRGPRSIEARLRRQGREDAFSTFQNTFLHGDVAILLCNIRSLVRNVGELIGRIKLMDREPDIICLNETWLDKSIKSVSIDGYVCVGRRDRKSGQKCGGIATYARSGLATQITLLEDSMSAERQWLLIHADQGPILLCNWYRPPDDATSVETLEEEWQRHAEVALKRIIVGDLNLHQRSWLRHSSGDIPLGKEMREKMSRMGLSQIVKEPTRNDHLLDLVLTDCEDVTAAVCGKITDHRLVLTTMRARISECKVRERTV